MPWQEYQVMSGDGRDICNWTVYGDDEEDALQRAREEQRRGGGGGTIIVRGPLTPVCDHCGFKHSKPPVHLAPDSYCR